MLFQAHLIALQNDLATAHLRYEVQKPGVCKLAILVTGQGIGQSLCLLQSIARLLCTGASPGLCLQQDKAYKVQIDGKYVTDELLVDAEIA